MSDLVRIHIVGFLVSRLKKKKTSKGKDEQWPGTWYSIWAATWENQQCGFWLGLTQTRLYSYWRWLEAGNFVFRKKRYCTIQVAETKALISFAVTAKLICVFVFHICRTSVFSWRGSYLCLYLCRGMRYSTFAPKSNCKNPVIWAQNYCKWQKHHILSS